MKSRLAAVLLLITLSSLAWTQVRVGTVRISSNVMQGFLEKKVQPEYPATAKKADIQGAVALKARIDKEGNVINLQLISGHPMLAPAAIEAVKQWKYKPYLLNGEPVEVETTVTVNFTLAEPPAAGATADNASGQDGGAAGAFPSVPGTAQAVTPKRVRVSSGVAQGLLVTNVQPEYPPDAREQRIQGVVLLHAIISKEGDIANLELISGHPLLAPAAIEAVKQWKYKPYLLNNTPLEVDTQIQVNFTLLE
jgi:TonB family protein